MQKCYNRISPLLNMHRIFEKLRRWNKKRQLDRLWRSSQGDCHVDYGWIRLPYNKDGDFQELLYHVYNREWRKNELDAFSRYVHPGDFVVDVGGNMGFVCTILSELVGSTGKVVSFEPNPLTFKKLQQTTAINKLLNVELHNLGCGTSASTAQLSWVSNSSGHCRILDPTENQSQLNLRTETIQIVRLDEFLSVYPQRVAFLKIDTEGYEPGVLEGARGRITQDKPVIYIELAEDFKESAQGARKILMELGYTLPGLGDLVGVSNGANFIALPPGHKSSQADSQETA